MPPFIPRHFQGLARTSPFWKDNNTCKSFCSMLRSNVTLPILPHLLNHHMSPEMLLATNPCVASPCVASPGASTTSHAVASPSSTPIGASPFKMDGYDSKTTHSRRSNKDGGSDAGTHKAETRETTTLMIRNLPSHVTQTDLLHELNKLGLSKLYDFCYLPRDFNVVENKGSLVNHLVYLNL